MNDSASAHSLLCHAGATQSADSAPATDPGVMPSIRILPEQRHIALRIDANRVQRFHKELARRLAQAPGVRVSFLRGPSAATLSSIKLLFWLERLTYRLSTPLLSDDVRDEAIQCLEHPDSPVDLVIDLTGSSEATDNPTIRVLFNGSVEPTVLFDALVSGQMPVIAIEATESGKICAVGIPSADNARTMLEAYECVLARTMTLLVAAAKRPMAELKPQPLPTRRHNSASLAESLARRLKHSVSRALYRMCCYAPHWRTCWRRVAGPDLWETQNLADTRWSVIPDPGFRFFADPFPFIDEGRLCVFVEDLDHRTGKGVISVLPFDENGPCGPAEPVLEEGWHLSYPFVFKHNGQIWMIPESSSNQTVTLYRAERFPNRWTKEADLLTGVQASDATITHHDGRFWMFAATRDWVGSWSDTLSIYSAVDLFGPWVPHAANPVLIDQASARPAGAFVRRNGKLWRPVQDCTAGYGTGIGLAEVERLDQEGFQQQVRAVLRAPRGWPGRRLHTLNSAAHYEFIDGAAHAPKSTAVAQLLAAWSSDSTVTGMRSPAAKNSMIPANQAEQ